MLAKKGRSLYALEPLCGIGKLFMAMEGYEPNLSHDCLNFANKSLRIIVGIHTHSLKLNYQRISSHTVGRVMKYPYIFTCVV